MIGERKKERERRRIRGVESFVSFFLSLSLSLGFFCLLIPLPNAPAPPVFWLSNFAQRSLLIYFAVEPGEWHRRLHIIVAAGAQLSTEDFGSVDADADDG